MHKRIFRIAVLMMALHTREALCQTIDLEHSLHAKIESFRGGLPNATELEEVKKTFKGYTNEELANALIAEIDVDRGNQSNNHWRDVTLRDFYKALNLPPALICKELEKDQSPQRKASLMTLLMGWKLPEVTTALLRQLKDHRPAVEFYGDSETPAHALRVCDVACSILNYNLDSDIYARKIGYTTSDERRDEIIKQTLKDLKLNSSQ